MSHEITGATRVCFVVASPVAHLRTPQVLNRVWEERGTDVVTVPAHVSPAGLPDFFVALRADESAVGAVVTVPHKQSALESCDELGPNAEIVRAVNVVRRTPDGRLIGETFDGLGFVEGLRAEGIDPKGLRTVLLGAGGAASAVAVGLLGAGVTRLDISNRNPARAADLVALLRRAFPEARIGMGLDGLADAQLIVNATSSGLSPSDASPLPAESMPAGVIAADVVMSAERTPFLAAAASRGNRLHEGAHMLSGQIQLIADFVDG
jgi:shikimate dehydrogenase